MNIIILGEWLSGLGDEGICNFARGLASCWERKHHVHIISLGSALTINRLFVSLQLRRALKTANPHVIFYISPSSAKPIALFRAKMLKIYVPEAKVCVVALQPMAHGVIGAQIMRLFSPAYFFVQSRKGSQALCRLGSSVHFLPSGVDVGRFMPVASEEQKGNLRKEYGIGENAFLVLHVGHINPNRNIALLKSVAGIGDTTVVMVGSTSTPQDQALLENIRSAGVIVMTDYIPHIEEIYKMADVYLFPVVSDDAAIGVPLSVLEAMACNLPIITTRFGGLPEMFTEGNGFFYFDSVDELPGLLDRVSALIVSRTREMVTPYDWKCVGNRLLAETFGDESDVPMVRT